MRQTTSFLFMYQPLTSSTDQGLTGRWAGSSPDLSPTVATFGAIRETRRLPPNPVDELDDLRMLEQCRDRGIGLLEFGFGEKRMDLVVANAVQSHGLFPSPASWNQVVLVPLLCWDDPFAEGANIWNAGRIPGMLLLSVLPRQASLLKFVRGLDIKDLVHRLSMIGESVTCAAAPPIL